MAEVISELKKEGLFYGDKVRVKKEDDEGGDVVVSEDEVPKKRDKKEKSKKDEKQAKKDEKKDKKDKKRKREASSDLSEI